MKDEQALNRILGHLLSIQEYMTSISSSRDFLNNKMILEAVSFNLSQIGEIAKHQLSLTIKEHYPDIVWKGIYGFRNRIIHDYENINMDIVYDVVQNELPRLKAMIINILADMKVGT